MYARLENGQIPGWNINGRYAIAGPPWHAIDLAFQWTAYLLSRWALLEVLEYLGILSVLFAVIFCYSEAGDRKKQKHYQA